MKYNVNEVKWSIIKVKGKLCFFSDVRIDRTTVPEGFNIYEVADNDSDGNPSYFANGILVNFYGTIITTYKFKYNDDKYCDINNGEWEYSFNKYYKWSDLLSMLEKNEIKI
jgi:hypothetical protein